MTAPTTPPLPVLERYYDAAPRASATAEEFGPFTLFLRTDESGHPFYARPRLGLATTVSAADVRAARARLRELGAPEAFEWVHETTPSLIDAALAADTHVTRCPLLVLAGTDVAAASPPCRVALLSPDAEDLAQVMGAVNAGFGGSDDVADPGEAAVGRRRRMLREGLVAMAAAYDGEGAVVGGGSHGPRDGTTELTGIAVLPRARRIGVGAALTGALVADATSRGATTIFLSAQDSAVARVYERVGFAPVGTACLGEVAWPA